MNKAFIFDWSGTLSDDFDVFTQVVALMFKILGKEPISGEEIRANFTLPYMKFWNKYFPDLTKDYQCELFERFVHQVEDPEIHPSATALLKQLHEADWKIFVLSSNPISKLSLEVEASGLLSYIQKVIGDVHEKGDVITAICDEFELDRTQCYYIGDTSGDVEAGKQASVRTVGITWGFQDREKLAVAEPEFLVDDLSEIATIVHLR